MRYDFFRRRLLLWIGGLAVGWGLALLTQGLANSASEPRATSLSRANPLAMSLATSLDRISVDTVSDLQATGYPDSRKVVRDSQDNIYVAYRKKSDDGSQHIFVAQLLNNSTKFTNKEKSIETTLLPYTQRVPSLAIDENNTLHVVWYGTDEKSQGDNDRQIKYTRARLTAGGKMKWDPVTQPAGIITGFAAISPPPTLWQEHPVIFAGPQRTLYIAWEGKDQDHPQNAQVKWIKSRDGGATWSTWQNIPGDAQTYYSRPALVATSDGRKLYLLAYATARNGIAQIVWTQSLDNDNTPGDSWDKWRYVTDNNGDGKSESRQDQRHFSVVLDSQQGLHVVWRQKVEGSPVAAKPQIYYSAYQQGNWHPATLLMPNPQINQSFPSLTVDKDNRLWAVWSETQTLAKFPNEEPETGEIHAAKKPMLAKWQPTTTPIHSVGQQALYPSLRWQRYGTKYGVDLIWLENTVSDPNNTSCMEGGQIKCTIYYANLAGQ